MADSVVGWNFQDKYVQSNIDPGGAFIRGASVLLAAGPPTLEIATSTNNLANTVFNGKTDINGTAFSFAHPIGLVDNVSIGQNKNLQQIFEIGSDRRYFIPGRTINQMSLQRVLFDGPSLMKVMYSYYIRPDKTHNNPNTAFLTGSKDQIPAPVRNQPGFDQTFLNLASELFNRPVGLLMLMNNSKNQSVAAAYFEYVFFRAHQFNISSSSTLIAESIQADYDKMVPLNMNFQRIFGSTQPGLA
jgi:hypothetical protein